MWWITVVIFVGFYVWGALRWGAGKSLAIVVPLTWIIPAWLMLPIADGAPDSIVGSGLDVKVTVGAACLILYCFMPGRTFPIKLVPSDCAVLSLLIVHIAIDILHDGFDWMVLGRAYAEWYLPYITGRLAFQTLEDVDWIWRNLVGLGIALGLLAIIESLTGTNPFELLVGQRPLEGFLHKTYRWGVTRAYGPTMHPIYLGVILLLTLGWATYGSLLALHRRSSAFLVLATLPILFGIAATGSRGPILGSLIAAVAFTYFLVPRTRMPIGLALVGLFILAATFHEPIIQKLEQWSGERQWEIQIEGETRLNSSVRSRFNVLEVNRIALRRSGLIGFGTEAVSGFPINVPLGPIEAEAIKSVWAIDNTYILMMLRFGYLGAGLLLLSAALSVWQFYWIAQKYPESRVQWLSCSVGGGLLAALLVQCTVWMPHEIGFPLVWTWGLSAGLMVAHREELL